MTHAGCAAIDVRGRSVVVRTLDQPEPPGPAQDADLRARWAQRCRDNPRLHDGPIWSVTDVAHGPDRVELMVVPERYSRLVAQRPASVGGAAAGPELGVRLLGAKGFITGRDSAGREHGLIAQRGPGVRSFAGMWECCPAGAVDRRPGVGVGAQDLWRTLIEEAAQELGVASVSIGGPGPAGREAGAHAAGGLVEWGGALACLSCPESCSVDVVIQGRYRGVIEPGAGWPSVDAGRAWEVGAVRWVELDAIAALVAQSGRTIAPPTRALWAMLSLA